MEWHDAGSGTAALHEVAYSTEVVAMGSEPERQLVEVLTNVVDELRDLQAAGRMRDSESQRHVEFLERGLRHAECRLASREGIRRSSDGVSPVIGRGMLA